MSIMKQILDYIFSGEVGEEASDQIHSSTQDLKLEQSCGTTLMVFEGNLCSDIYLYTVCSICLYVTIKGLCSSSITERI